VAGILTKSTIFGCLFHNGMVWEKLKG